MKLMSCGRQIGESAILDFLGVSRDRVTCAMRQIKGNLIINRKVLVSLCDWINSFEAIWRNVIWDCLETYRTVSCDRAFHFHIPNYGSFCSNQIISNELKRLEQQFGKGFEICFQKFYLAVIFKNGGYRTLRHLLNLGHKHSYSRNL